MGCKASGTPTGLQVLSHGLPLKAVFGKEDASGSPVSAGDPLQVSWLLHALPRTLKSVPVQLSMPLAVRFLVGWTVAGCAAFAVLTAPFLRNTGCHKLPLSLGSMPLWFCACRHSTGPAMR